METCLKPSCFLLGQVNISLPAVALSCPVGIPQSSSKSSSCPTPEPISYPSLLGPTRNAATGVHLIASQAGNFSKGADTDSSAYWALRYCVGERGLWGSNTSSSWIRAHPPHFPSATSQRNRNKTPSLPFPVLFIRSPVPSESS